MELKGLENIKAMFKDMGFELSPSQVRGIITAAGQMVAKEARGMVEERGEIGVLLKQDIGVYRDTRKSSRNAEYVIVGPRFKQYSIRGRQEKVALIAQHMTEGFRQTERLTRSGKRRGRVMERFHNPVTAALRARSKDVDSALRKGTDRQLKRIKAKYPQLVR